MKHIFKASLIAGAISAILAFGLSNFQLFLTSIIKSFVMTSIITFVAIAIVYGVNK